MLWISCSSHGDTYFTVMTVISSDRLEQTLADFKPPKLTWNNSSPLSTPGNGPAKSNVTDHFLCSFPKWGTAPSGNNRTRTHKADAREGLLGTEENCLFRVSCMINLLLMAPLQRAKGQSQIQETQVAGEGGADGLYLWPWWYNL